METSKACTRSSRNCARCHGAGQSHGQRSERRRGRERDRERQPGEPASPRPASRRRDPHHGERHEQHAADVARQRRADRQAEQREVAPAASARARQREHRGAERQQPDDVFGIGLRVRDELRLQHEQQHRERREQPSADLASPHVLARVRAFQRVSSRALAPRDPSHQPHGERAREQVDEVEAEVASRLPEQPIHHRRQRRPQRVGGELVARQLVPGPARQRPAADRPPRSARGSARRPDSSRCSSQVMP